MTLVKFINQKFVSSLKHFSRFPERRAVFGAACLFAVVEIGFMMLIGFFKVELLNVQRYCILSFKLGLVQSIGGHWH